MKIHMIIYLHDRIYGRRKLNYSNFKRISCHTVVQIWSLYTYEWNDDIHERIYDC